jgi:NAD(P)-dependent dehydrogenase (short-subunit alcohol dehydrogenase family)
VQAAEGRVVLLTGGLGGIGTVACRSLTEAGASVMVNDIETAPPPGSLPAEGARYIRADGSRPEEAARIIAETVATFGGLSDVVLLAGTVASAPLLEQSAEAAAEVFRVNVTAAMTTAQAAVRWWLSEKLPGNLVFVGSWVQDVPWPGIATYSASKAAVRSLARSFAREFATRGVRANVLAPGIVDAGMARRQWDEEPDYRRRAQQAIPLRRLQPAQSVADAIVFLCSPSSAYMTGSTLLVDGGASLYPLSPEESEEVAP